MLTESQINNISKLDIETKLQIMHICADDLGLVSIDEYCQIMEVKRRATYYKIESGLIKHFPIGQHKFPLINDK
jgi:hypothetical protein